MELDLILCWLVGISSGASLFRTGLRQRAWGWVGVHLFILAVLGAGLLFALPRPGTIALVAWAPLVGAPLLIGRLLARAGARADFRAALRLSRVLAVLHPLDGLREQPPYFAALDRIQRGDLEAARREAESLPAASPLRRFVLVQLLRIEGRWADTAALLEREVGLARLPGDVDAFIMYARAIGELGRDADLVDLAARCPPSARPSLALFVAAFTGRVELATTLMDGPLAPFGDASRALWLATAHQRAGEPDAASAILDRLDGSGDAYVRATLRVRRETPFAPFDPAALSEDRRAALDALVAGLHDELRYPAPGNLSARRRPAVLTGALGVANLGAFLLELRGGSTDLENLIALGALVVPPELVDDAWRRVLTAGFLHFGATHLALNMAGLWFLGRYVEAVWGRFRMLACYLAATLGANVVGLLILGGGDSPDPIVIVGASGGVMGLLGASVGFIAVEWRRRRLPLLRRQLAAFGLLLALQIVFDLSTPRVSSTLHLAGLLIGMLVAVGLALLARPGDETDGPPDR